MPTSRLKGQKNFHDFTKLKLCTQTLFKLTSELRVKMKSTKVQTLGAMRYAYVCKEHIIRM